MTAVASGSSSVVAVLKPVKPSIRDDLDGVAPRLGPLGEPLFEGLLGAALDHVQQPRWAGVVADAGQVDDHGDVLVAAAGVAPHVLVDSDHLHPLEPRGVVDQDALALGQDRVVGGVPRDSEAFGDTGDGEVLDDDPFQSPPQTAARQLGPRLGCAAGVLAPHVTAAAAPVPAHVHLQRGGPPPQRLVRQPSGHRVTRDAFAAAAAAPLVRVDDSAGQHRTVGVESLAEDFQAELVQMAERSQVRTGEGSVRHVEVFRMGSV